MEQVRAVHWTESEPESGTLVAGSYVLGRGPGNIKRSIEPGQGRKDTTRSALTFQAMAYARAKDIAVNPDPELTTGTGSLATFS
jgi:hypothetical protein